MRKYILPFCAYVSVFAAIVVGVQAQTPLPTASSLQQANGSAIAGAQQLLSSTELLISQVSANFGPVGTRVVLGGSGFGTDSVVNFGRQKISVSTLNPRGISFVVPRVSTGRYDVTVTVNKKTSDPIPFMVTTAGAQPPVIEKIEPATAVFGKTITITGKNFTRTDNVVTTGIGIISGLKSTDGKTIVFKISTPDYLKEKKAKVRQTWFGERDNLYWQMYARVVNENGISSPSDTSKFIINL